MNAVGLVTIAQISDRAGTAKYFWNITSLTSEGVTRQSSNLQPSASSKLDMWLDPVISIA